MACGHGDHDDLVTTWTLAVLANLPTPFLTPKRVSAAGVERRLSQIGDDQRPALCGRRVRIFFATGERRSLHYLHANAQVILQSYNLDIDSREVYQALPRPALCPMVNAGPSKVGGSIE
jgi:hypothetical protein